MATTDSASRTRRSAAGTPTLSVAEQVCLALVVEGQSHGWAIGTLLAPEGDVGRVWTLSRPLTYRAVDGLVDKGLVARVVTGHGPAYQPTRDAEDMAVERMRTALGAVSNRTAALQRFVTSLDDDDEATLRALLGGGA